MLSAHGWQSCRMNMTSVFVARVKLTPTSAGAGPPTRSCARFGDPAGCHALTASVATTPVAAMTVATFAAMSNRDVMSAIDRTDVLIAVVVAAVRLAVFVGEAPVELRLNDALSVGETVLVAERAAFDPNPAVLDLAKAVRRIGGAWIVSVPVGIIHELPVGAIEVGGSLGLAVASGVNHFEDGPGEHRHSGPERSHRQQSNQSLSHVGLHFARIARSRLIPSLGSRFNCRW